MTTPKQPRSRRGDGSEETNAVIINDDDDQEDGAPPSPGPSTSKLRPRDDSKLTASQQDGRESSNYYRATRDYYYYYYYYWVVFGATLAIVVALLFRSTPYPYWQYSDAADTDSDPSSELLHVIRTGRNNITHCPGYVLDSDSLKENRNGFIAQLNLAGPPCNAFGNDIPNLTIHVTYDTSSRLHVNIFDNSARQFTLPPEYFDLPSSKSSKELISPADADLLFNYEPSPFAFWITRQRQSDPDAMAVPIFDTRLTSLPSPPIPAGLKAGLGHRHHHPSLSFDGFPLVFEDNYLQLTSALPLDANIYGLGEVVASSGFRRDVRNGTIQTMWNRDEADPLDENIYGSHPVYLEHRWVPSASSFQSHGVFLASAAGSDIILATPPSSNQSLIQYRLIGGTLDLYFFSGPDPKSVIEQYGQVVGLPGRPPNWGFGFHLCRWGYTSLSETKQQVDAMRAANIPLEVMWNDLELYHDYRDFTVDPVAFPADEMRAFVRNLNANGQHYIPIVHGYAALPLNATDRYDPFTRGTELDVFIHNPDQSVFIGQVWPGYTVFPDWLASNVSFWWKEALRNWTSLGVEFSGLWLDMNEVKSFCDGHCAPTDDQPTYSTLIILPGNPGNLVTGYPEGYNATVSGPSGNITVNGSLTYGAGIPPLLDNLNGDALKNLNPTHSPELPYAIHNVLGDLSAQTIATNATHYGGRTELDLHNLFGHLMSRETYLAVRELYPGKRPFLISRSTFSGSGRWTGHWLGDNWSKWSYLHHSIQGVLQFQLFQIPMVGADACGFVGNTDEELCNRWMQLAAFTPFFRNHNIRGAIPQEPYRWDSVAQASRAAIAVRYALLPYWYTLFANSSLYGTPPIRALFFEFPQESELLSVDRQFMVGSDILVTPVLTPNVSSVSGFLPGRGQVIWRDWYTHAVVSGMHPGESTVVLDAPLGHIPVLVRSGAALLLHSQPGYTTRASATEPYSLLISLTSDGHAYGTALIDDGETLLPDNDESQDSSGVRARATATQSREIAFDAHDKQVHIVGDGTFDVVQPLNVITVLGVNRTPQRVRLDGVRVPSRKWVYTSAVQRLFISDLAIDLNERVVVTWE